MRPLRALPLLLVLFAASPARAASGLDDMGSEQQTEGYGKLFGIACGAVAGIAVLAGGYIVIKGMMAEHGRGKKVSVFTDILDTDDAKKKRREPALRLGEKVPDWKIKNRMAATWAALNYLGKSDDWWDPKLMTEFVTQAFEAVKAGIEVRSTKKMAKRLTDECLDGIKAEIKKLAKKREIHVLDKLEIVEVQLVHFEAPASKTKHTFTALISAVSRNFYKDEKTGEVLRGDKKLYETQEFWRFRRAKDFWLVERIREAGDMDVVLEHKNVMTPTDMAAFSKKADEAFLREFAEK
jgi:hypothetical protein